MTTPNEDLEQRVAELQANLLGEVLRVANLQSEALSKDFFRKIDTIIESLVPANKYPYIYGKAVVAKRGIECQREREFSYFEYSYSILYNCRTVFFGCIYNEFDSYLTHNDTDNTSETLEKIERLCDKDRRPYSVRVYHPGNWEQDLDSLYREAIEFLKGGKTRREIDREEQRIKTLRENFG